MEQGQVRLKRSSAALALLCAGLTMAGCTALLPAQSNEGAVAFTSYDDVLGAYDRIQPGVSSEADLANLGFNTRSGNVQVLSYLGVVERFMPREAIKFDMLDPAVRDCIKAEAHCNGLVFTPTHDSSKRVGNTFLDVMGFERVTRHKKWSAEVLVLMQDGRVTHKVFAGSPQTESVEDKVQPLGPLQDVGSALVSGAEHIPSY